MPDTVVFLLMALGVAVLAGVAAGLAYVVMRLAGRERLCPHRPALHHPDQRGRLRCEMCGRPAPTLR